MKTALQVTTFLTMSWLGLCVGAQDGSNFLVMNNGMDALYGGLGAGGSQVAGVDGLGTFWMGESMRGNTLTDLGDFGYREAGFRESVCVLGAPQPNLAIEFPLLAVIELDGVNPYLPDNVFSIPFCPTAGCFPLGNSMGVVPYGEPAGVTSSFVLAGLPSGVGLPSSTQLLLPNNALLPSTTQGGTATLLGAMTATLPIASTGFCWVVQFNWAPSSLNASDDINGWWRWRTNSTAGNQYWGMSNDELGVWQSNTVATDGGGAGLTTFFANMSYETHSLSATPTTNLALAPLGRSGNGPYYTTGQGVPGSGSSVNGGFDLGVHGGIATTGMGGVPNPATGLANQNPMGAATPGLLPTMGFVSWSNGPDTALGSTLRIVWLQLNFDVSLAVDPALAGDALQQFGLIRFPIQIPTVPGPWLQPLTVSFASLLVHDVADRTGIAAWPDPNDLPPGSMGVPPFVGSTAHLPTLNTGAWNLGFPIGLQAGSSAIGSPTGPLRGALHGRGAPSPGSGFGGLGGP
ncbi:MAG: hypothetical protein ACI9EF_002613 [Pseudohongiellaceae bacterium]|jgi:hypothetical protein